MKPARTAGSTLSLLREFFPPSVGLLQRQPSRCDRVTEKVKAFAAGRTPLQIASVLLAHKATLFRRFTVCSRLFVAQVY
jgi:hypothetical protein